MNYLYLFNNYIQMINRYFSIMLTKETSVLIFKIYLNTANHYFHKFEYKK
jgi:hypothetical protein